MTKPRTEPECSRLRSQPLVNGGTGIAVAWPQHGTPNLGEIIDGICAQIDTGDFHRRVDEAREKARIFNRLHGLRGQPINNILRRAGQLEVRGKVGVEQLREPRANHRHRKFLTTESATLSSGSPAG